MGFWKDSACCVPHLPGHRHFMSLDPYPPPEKDSELAMVSPNLEDTACLRLIGYIFWAVTLNQTRTMQSSSQEKSRMHYSLWALEGAKSPRWKIDPPSLGHGLGG